MAKKFIMAILFIGLALVTVGCGGVTEQLTSFSLLAPATTEKPCSIFVSPQESIQTGVGQPVQIESHHRSKNGLGKLDIFINGQPPQSELSSGQATFSTALATTAIVIDGQPVLASSIEPQYPTSAWTVSIQWVGRTSGTYDLSLQVTDQAGQTGEPIVQRIEVK